jgi:hypothetical protein
MGSDGPLPGPSRGQASLVLSTKPDAIQSRSLPEIFTNRAIPPTNCRSAIGTQIPVLLQQHISQHATSCKRIVNVTDIVTPIEMLQILEAFFLDTKRAFDILANALHKFRPLTYWASIFPSFLWESKTTRPAMVAPVAQKIRAVENSSTSFGIIRDRPCLFGQPMVFLQQVHDCRISPCNVLVIPGTGVAR